LSPVWTDYETRGKAKVAIATYEKPFVTGLLDKTDKSQTDLHVILTNASP